MEKFFDYISDAAIVCMIVQCEDTGKIDLKVIYANKKMEVITNISNDLLIGHNMTDVFPELRNTVFDWPKILSEAAMTNNSKIIEQYFAGFEKYLSLKVFGYKDGCFDVVLTDLTEKKEIKRRILERDRQIKLLETELEERANVDMLTKMYNFQFIIDCIINSIESYKEEGENFCLLIMDIDNFKEINRIHGIKAGDAILKDIAILLSSVARKIDVVGRYGNDKFILVLNNLDIDIAKIMVERIKQDIKKNCKKSGNTEISLSGVLLEYSGQSVETLLYKAELQMEKAKSIGKGTVIS